MMLGAALCGYVAAKTARMALLAVLAAGADAAPTLRAPAPRAEPTEGRRPCPDSPDALRLLPPDEIASEAYGVSLLRHEAPGPSAPALPPVAAPAGDVVVVGDAGPVSLPPAPKDRPWSVAWSLPALAARFVEDEESWHARADWLTTTRTGRVHVRVRGRLGDGSDAPNDLTGAAVLVRPLHSGEPEAGRFLAFGAEGVAALSLFRERYVAPRAARLRAACAGRASACCPMTLELAGLIRADLDRDGAAEIVGFLLWRRAAAEPGAAMEDTVCAGEIGVVWAPPGDRIATAAGFLDGAAWGGGFRSVNVIPPSLDGGRVGLFATWGPPEGVGAFGARLDGSEFVPVLPSDVHREGYFEAWLQPSLTGRARYCVVKQRDSYLWRRELGIFPPQPAPPAPTPDCPVGFVASGGVCGLAPQPSADVPGPAGAADRPAGDLPGYVRLSPGELPMGSPESEPGSDTDETRHIVRLTRPFWLKATEVTQDEWRARMGPGRPRFEACGGTCPVESVSWWDVLAYCNTLSRAEGLPECYELVGCSAPGARVPSCRQVWLRSADGTPYGCAGYRLPTEAEWEYAARAGTDTAVPTGSLTLRGAMDAPELEPVAWYGGNSGVSWDDGVECADWPARQQYAERCGPHPVAGKQANPWGLFDLLGNVQELVWDGYGPYPGGLVVDPTGELPRHSVVARGGGWRSEARFVRTAARSSVSVRTRSDDLGFRPARTIPPVR
jgi:formylglycine-generating enzyme required for sulfatase activity